MANSWISSVVSIFAISILGSSQVSYGLSTPQPPGSYHGYLSSISDRFIGARDDTSIDCRLNYTTGLWTTCQDMLLTFNISLSNFVAINPGLASDCTGFTPGDTYCVRVAGNTTTSSIDISTDGLCGSQANWTVTCVDSSFGNCCSSSGYCGSSSSYCGQGYCQEGDCDGGVDYSLDGTCGTDYDDTLCGSNYGTSACCSEYGYCGTGTDFCGTGCQSGSCVNGTATTSSVVSTSTGGISSDGTCGYSSAYNCEGSSYGDCCSSAGYCGSDQYSCLDIQGCQSAYGTCNDESDYDQNTTVASSGTSTYDDWRTWTDLVTTSITTKSSNHKTTVSSARTTSTPSSDSSNSTIIQSSSSASSTVLSTSNTLTSTSAAATSSGASSNCSEYYTVQSGDYCYLIETDFGITLDQFQAWNPSLDCSDLQIGDSWCVAESSVVSSSTVVPTSTSTSIITATTSGGVTTPTPHSANLIAGCDDFYLVQSGDGCYDIAASNGISLDDFYTWNPDLDDSCDLLIAGDYYCVGLA